jgi:hypothetical protein
VTPGTHRAFLAAAMIARLAVRSASPRQQIAHCVSCQAPPRPPPGPRPVAREPPKVPRLAAKPGLLARRSGTPARGLATGIARKGPPSHA